MKKIHGQLYMSVIQPPSGGPSTGDTTTAMPQIANARPRLAGGNVSASMAWELGIIPPPPSPCSTRNAISCGRLVAMPHRKLAIVNVTTQMTKNCLRPRMSLSQPQIGRMAAFATR